MTESRKYKWIHFTAVAVAGLTIVAVLVNGVFNKLIEAEAADTLIGIEKLRTRVKDSGNEYVVLEIVPDKSAAEIGFLFSGYEPILGDWDENGKWKSWKDLLCEEPNKNDREALVEKLKAKLNDYYVAIGMDSDGPFPVEPASGTYEEWDEGSTEPKENFEEITAGGYEASGWFEIEASSGYNVSFDFKGKSNELTKSFLPYTVAVSISVEDYLEEHEDDPDPISSDTYIYYVPEGEEGKDIFVYAGTWGEIKETVGMFIMNKPDLDETVSGNDSSEDTEDESDDIEGGEGNDDNASNENDGDVSDEPGTEGTDNDGSEPGIEDENGIAGNGDNNADGNGDETESGGKDDDVEIESDTGSTEESEPVPSSTGEDDIEKNLMSFSVNASAGKWFLLAQDEPVDESGNQSGVDGTGVENTVSGTNSNNTNSEEQDSVTDDPEDSNKNDDGDGDDEELPADDDEPSDGDGEDIDGEGSEDGEDEEEEENEEDIEDIEDEDADIRTLAAGDIAGYYLVEFKRMEHGTQPDDSTPVYAVNEIVRSSNGQYTFHEVDEADVEAGNVNEFVDYQTYTFPGTTIYCRNTFTSNEWFKKYVINMETNEYDNFPVKVLTYTPKELDELYNTEGLPDFDFLYLNSGLRAWTWEAGSGDFESKEPLYKDENNALSDDVLKALLNETITSEKPCLVDGAILYKTENDVPVENEDLNRTNIFKLAALLCQKDLNEWDKNNLDSYIVRTMETLIAGIVEDADKNFVNEQVYCIFGNHPMINAYFNTANIYHEDDGMPGEIEEGFEKVLEDIKLENLYRKADTSGSFGQLSLDISQATVLRHILNYADRRKVETKKNIKVLEIQPAKADSPEITLEQIKKWAPEVETADITSMTTSEFIGKIEKLNETYDLIYIGTSKDHLNMRYWVGDTGYTGKPNTSHIAAGTVFNDSNMDGLIYYNIGDLRVVSLQLAGQLDIEYWWGNRNEYPYFYNYVRYPGNDITEEKMKALLSFMDGSYPIVIADDILEQPATVFADTNYGGARVSLSEGSYTRAQLNSLGINALDISSIKVKAGYKLTAYQTDNFIGTNTGYTADNAQLGSFNHRIYSIRVEKLEESTPIRKIDADRIDNCTYLYEFLDKALDKQYENFFAWSNITDESELFKFYLNRPKASLTDTWVNGDVKAGSGSDVRYIQAGSNGKYVLQYGFTIRNEGAASSNTRYQCKLYIDVNSDGKFSEQEEMSDITLTQGGGYVSQNELYADRKYELTREVPMGYKGLLPWKVEITQADNPNIYTSMQGYTKLVGLEKETIKVLQISRNGYDTMFDLGAEIEHPLADFHKLVYGGDINGIHYDGITDDFDIDVTYMQIWEYQQKFYANNINLDDYNMLILGFNDMGGDIEGTATSGPMGAIVKFINSGKSVLFSHDTTSIYNYPSSDNLGYPWRDSGANYGHGNNTRWINEAYNAYTLNQYVRPLVGMDRYGILDSGIGGILKAGKSLFEGNTNFNKVISSRYDVAYKPKSGKKVTVPQVHGYTYMIISGKDKEAGGDDNWYNKDSYSKWEIYDISRADDSSYNIYSSYDYASRLPDNVNFRNTYRNIRYDQVYYKNGATDYGEVGSWRGDMINSWAEIENLSVTQVNQGQITEYPYKLGETFEVKETHGQWYQLDYTADDDGDGESDLVVWYCLGKRNGNQETVYSQSPNDVRNNYYIYNKGNITYTGMGHSVQRTWPPYTVDEAKLFINTIIAAYQAGVRDPYISALKTGTKDSEELNTLYRYYDPAYNLSLDSGTTGATEKIYFTVQDTNFIKGTRQIESHVYYENAGSSTKITVDGVDIRVTRLDTGTFYKASDGTPVPANNLESEGIYYVEVPKSILEQCENGLTLYFEAQTMLTTATTNPNVYTTEKAYAKLRVLQAYLFNLE